MARILRIRSRDEAVVAMPNVSRFDLPETDSFREELAELTSTHERKPLLLDLSEVDFVTSATLGVLGELAGRCKDDGRPLALVRVRPRVLQVLRVCSLDRVLAIHDDEEQALASAAFSARDDSAG